jgi:hypothetical protein
VGGSQPGTSAVGCSDAGLGTRYEWARAGIAGGRARGEFLCGPAGGTGLGRPCARE